MGGVPSKSKQRRKLLTNEELFYDPEMDEIDEKWVNKQRENNSLSGIVIFLLYCSLSPYRCVDKGTQP